MKVFVLEYEIDGKPTPDNDVAPYTHYPKDSVVINPDHIVSIEWLHTYYRFTMSDGTKFDRVYGFRKCNLEGITKAHHFDLKED